MELLHTYVRFAGLLTYRSRMSQLFALSPLIRGRETSRSTVMASKSHHKLRRRRLGFGSTLSSPVDEERNPQKGVDEAVEESKEAAGRKFGEEDEAWSPKVAVDTELSVQNQLPDTEAETERKKVEDIPVAMALKSRNKRKRKARKLEEDNYPKVAFEQQMANKNDDDRVFQKESYEPPTAVSQDKTSQSPELEKNIGTQKAVDGPQESSHLDMDLEEIKTHSPKADGEKEGSNSGSDSKSFQQKNCVIMPVQSKEVTQKESIASHGKIFTDDDVIVLLKGFFDFRDKSMSEYFGFIKDKLHTNFREIQVSDKIRKLKNKFLSNFKKAQKRQAPVNFSNEHDSMVFELSEKLWGRGGADKMALEKSKEKSRKRERLHGNSSIEGKKENVKKQKQIVEDEVDNEIVQDDAEACMESKYPLVRQSFDMNIGGVVAPYMLKKNWTLMGSAKAQDFEEEWRKIRIKELELLHKQIGLILQYLNG